MATEVSWDSSGGKTNPSPRVSFARAGSANALTPQLWHDAANVSDGSYALPHLCAIRCSAEIARLNRTSLSGHKSTAVPPVSPCPIARIRHKDRQACIHFSSRRILILAT